MKTNMCFWAHFAKYLSGREIIRTQKKLKLNSVAFSPQATYTDRATVACRRS
jgi:hypothetical protein